jgi:hypothetical protein
MRRHIGNTELVSSIVEAGCGLLMLATAHNLDIRSSHFLGSLFIDYVSIEITNRL